MKDLSASPGGGGEGGPGLSPVGSGETQGCFQQVSKWPELFQEGHPRRASMMWTDGENWGPATCCHMARGLSYCSSAPPDPGHPDPRQPWVSRCRVPTSGFPEQPMKSRFLGLTHNDGFSMEPGDLHFLKLPGECTCQSRRPAPPHPARAAVFASMPFSPFLYLFEFQPLLMCLLNNTLFQALLPPCAPKRPVLLPSRPLLDSVLAGRLPFWLPRYSP